MLFVIGLWTFLRALFLEPATVALENLALRHQLVVLRRSVGRPRFSRWDRILSVWFSRLWANSRSSLVIVQPATVLAWHRRGFQLYPGGTPWPTRSAARASTPRFAVRSGVWTARIPSAGAGASKRTSPCSATRSPC